MTKWGQISTSERWEVEIPCAGGGKGMGKGRGGGWMEKCKLHAFCVGAWETCVAFCNVLPVWHGTSITDEFHAKWCGLSPATCLSIDRFGACELYGMIQFIKSVCTFLGLKFKLVNWSGSQKDSSCYQIFACHSWRCSSARWWQRYGPRSSRRPWSSQPGRIWQRAAQAANQGIVIRRLYRWMDCCLLAISRFHIVEDLDLAAETSTWTLQIAMLHRFITHSFSNLTFRK